MYEAGYLFAESLLEDAAAGVGAMFFDEGVNFFAAEGGEDFDVAFGFCVAHVEPELVELVGRGVSAVEPYVALFGLAKLLAVGLGD